MFWNDGKRADPMPSPLPNTYWVEPGRLLAGEYPGAISRADAIERVQKLLGAGVTSFIDLTEEGELPEYDALLPELTEQRIRYRRLAVIDHGLPESPAHMGQIVDAIEDELSAGRCVYVHCRAGIGRTGMAIACWLVRSGLANQQALDHLQTLWRKCERSRRWPSVPETDEQVRFVREWRDLTRSPQGRAATLESRYQGALLGLALGDAFGSLAASGVVDAAAIAGGARGLHTGVYTASVRAVAESLSTLGRHEPGDQMQRYLQWMRTSPSAMIPSDFRRALAAWQWSRKPNAGSHDPRNLDPHSLPRTLAVALLLRAEPQKAFALAADVSRTTQQAPIVLDLCRAWAALFIDALNGASKADLAAWRSPVAQALRQRPLKPRVKALLDGRASAGASPHDALGVTSIALERFASTNTFRDALLEVAAHSHCECAVVLCGALAGAHYGLDAVPLDWRKRIDEHAALRALAQQLLT